MPARPPARPGPPAPAPGAAGRRRGEPPLAAALGGVPLFAALGPGQLAALARVARRARYRRGQAVFRQGDPGDTFYVVLSGQVRASATSPAGRERILAVLDAGAGFGESALLDDRPRPATLAATRPTEVVALRRADAVRLLRQLPDLGLGLLTALAKRLRATDQLAQDAARLGLGARLAKTLLALTETHGRPAAGGAIELTLELTQQELAAMVGATREAVNKQLRALRERGLVAVDRRRLTVLRPEGLRAGGPPPRPRGAGRGR